MIAAVTSAIAVVVIGAGGAVWWLLGPASPEEALEAGAQSGYGSDPALDSLWDRCEAGVLSACDELYFASPAGSDYEDFGATCGNRDGSPGLCEPTSGSNVAAEGGFGSDPELDLLWVECEEGIMFACDDLFFASPPGTAYEDFGATCGNRGPDIGDCVSRF